MPSRIDPEILLRTQRQMAWARAKGELDAMLCTFWNDDEAFTDLDAVVKEFIAKVDGEGLAE